MPKDCRCQFNNPVCANIILPIRGNKVLLAKRAVEPFKGSWDTIGGFMQGLEQPIDAALRELEEETGLALFDTDLEEEPTFSTYGTFKDERYPILHFVYTCFIEGTPKPNDDVAELRWFPLNSLPEIPLEGPRKALERFL